MLKTLRCIQPALTFCRSLTSKAPQRLPPDIGSRNNPDLERLLEQYKDSILYSTYQHKNTPNWRETQLAKRFGRKTAASKLSENIRVKPFSLAAQYLDSSDDTNESAKICQEQSASKDLTNVFAQRTTRKPFLIMTDDRPKDGSWMHDYESFNVPDDDVDLGVYGTPDPSIPVSQIPCYGCGSNLQCAEPSLPGYLPSEIFAGNPVSYLQTITCQRCHFLKTYNTVIDVTVKPEEYVRLISSISDKFAMAILMVDLMDFPCSIWPQIQTIIGTKRPVFIVGNKVDLLPQDSPGYLRHVKECLETAVELSGIPRGNIKHTSLISAETGFGVEELITKLHNVWKYKGDVYLLGCTNVGKSTLFNALLRSDYCKTKASSIIGKATASPWPGTTMRMLKFPILRPSDWKLYIRTKRILSMRAQRIAEEKLRRDQAKDTKDTKHATLIGHIGNSYLEQPTKNDSDEFAMGKRPPPLLSINENDKEYITSKWCFDTPGVVQPEQILNLLTTEELLLVIPKEMIKPRTYRLKPGMTLFLAGLGRLDYLLQASGGCPISVTVFASSKLPVVIVFTTEADRVYNEFLGSELLCVPCGNIERLQRWPELQSKDFKVSGKGSSEAACDFLFSSSGWIGINAEDGEMAHFRVWTPEGRGIVKRLPALIPYAKRLSGRRLRGSLAYSNQKSFISD